MQIWGLSLCRISCLYFWPLREPLPRPITTEVSIQLTFCQGDPSLMHVSSGRLLR